MTAEDGWIDVVSFRRTREERLKRRNEGRMDISLGCEEKERKNQNLGQISTFFFTEFPEDYGARDMYGIFMDYGDVVEVIIPPKRDRRGKKYGFISFNGVRDERSLVLQIDNICIDGKKVHANVPRFQRKYLPTIFPEKVPTSFEKRNSHLNKVDHVNTNNTNPERPLSYAQVVQGQPSKFKRGDQLTKTTIKKKNVWIPKPVQKKRLLHIFIMRLKKITL